MAIHQHVDSGLKVEEEEVEGEQEVEDSMLAGELQEGPTFQSSCHFFTLASTIFSVFLCLQGVVSL